MLLLGSGNAPDGNKFPKDWPFGRLATDELQSQGLGRPVRLLLGHGIALHSSQQGLLLANTCQELTTKIKMLISESNELIGLTLVWGQLNLSGQQIIVELRTGARPVAMVKATYWRVTGHPHDCRRTRLFRDQQQIGLVGRLQSSAARLSSASIGSEASASDSGGTKLASQHAKSLEQPAVVLN